MLRWDVVGIYLSRKNQVRLRLIIQEKSWQACYLMHSLCHIKITMSRNAMSCYMMSCYIISFYVMSYLIFSTHIPSLHLHSYSHYSSRCLDRLPCAQRSSPLWWHADNPVWGLLSATPCGAGQQESLLLRLCCVAVSSR